jgi:hypothetical protein
LSECDAYRADSIMGVTFYSDDAPNEFGKFDRALITMYRLTAGDTWVSIQIKSSSGELKTNTILK